jgi:hypothetical protein
MVVLMSGGGVGGVWRMGELKGKIAWAVYDRFIGRITATNL